MPKANKKITFSGSLARRVVLVCLALLVIPLFIHTFLLYRREILLEEQDVRSAMKSIGANMASSIQQQIQMDWKLIDAETPALAKVFKIERIMTPDGVKGHFVLVSKRREALLAGKVIAGGETHVIAHPLSELLEVKDPPFPMDATFMLWLEEQDEWVEHFSIDEGLTFSVGTSSERVAELKLSYILYRVGTFLALILFLGGGLVYWLTRKINRPLNALRGTMERVAEGGAHARYTPQMWGFEINAIGLEFNSALDRLLMHQQEAEKERIHREKLAQELKLGHDMQANLLPKVIPQIHHLKLAAGYLPAKEVSGDFYDVFPLPSGRMLLLVADIAGKGIPACLFSLGLRSSIRALASTTHDLSLLVEKANELFLHDAQESGMFATVWIAILDKNTLHYLNLGHPPALLKRHREIRELSTGHPALGLMKYESLKTHSIQLEPGDELLLYSDGVTEAHHADNELYGLRRLKDSFLRSRFGSSLDSILEEIELFSQNHPQKDDLTLLRLSKEMEV